MLIMATTARQFNRINYFVTSPPWFSTGDFLGSIYKLWFSGINWKSNYKSLVNLFKGRGCGQSPQILSVYAI